MSRKTLSIAIPTYNRAKNLALLLEAISREQTDTERDVEVLIFDNCSTDNTAAVAASFARGYPSARIQTNASNVGADRNIANCFEAASADYVWVVGDDDIPQGGFIQQLVALLKAESPHLVNITSKWLKRITPGDIEQLPVLKWRRLPVALFARRVNIWTTFISGIVVNKTYLLERMPGFEVGRFSGTNFVQLGWVLNAIRLGDRFLFIESAGVLATAGNSGGYSVIRVFGENFTRIVREVFSDCPQLASILVNRNLTDFMPGLIWDVRFKKSVGDFSFDPSNESVHKTLRGNPYYWLFFVPVAHFPKPLAWVNLKVSQVASRCLQARDRREMRRASA